MPHKNYYGNTCTKCLISLMVRLRNVHAVLAGHRVQHALRGAAGQEAAPLPPGSGQAGQRVQPGQRVPWHAKPY